MNVLEHIDLPHNVVISHPEKVAKAKERIRQAGPEHFFVLSDFAKTFTSEFNPDGSRLMPLVAQLRSGEYMQATNYAEQAQALFERYGHLEEDPTITHAELKRQWTEWWRVHFQLLLQSGLSKDILKAIAAKRQIPLRPGVRAFIALLQQHNIPLLFMSAAPGDLLKAHLEQEAIDDTNIHIVGNLYTFDANGHTTAIPDTIVHTHNKGDINIPTLPISKVIADRPHVLLLGDSLADAEMTASLDPTTMIKIGFLNKDIEKKLHDYANAYDIVITGDGPMDYVNDLLLELFS